MLPRFVAWLGQMLGVTDAYQLSYATSVSLAGLVVLLAYISCKLAAVLLAVVLSAIDRPE